MTLWISSLKRAYKNLIAFLKGKPVVELIYLPSDSLTQGILYKRESDTEWRMHHFTIQLLMMYPKGTHFLDIVESALWDVQGHRIRVIKNKYKISSIAQKAIQDTLKNRKEKRYGTPQG